MPKYFHGGEIHALIVDAKMCSVEVMLKERKQGLCVLVVISQPVTWHLPLFSFVYVEQQ